MPDKFVGCSNSGDGFIVNSWQRCCCTTNNVDWFAKLVAVVVDLGGWHPGKVVTALSGKIDLGRLGKPRKGLHLISLAAKVCYL